MRGKPRSTELAHVKGAREVSADDARDNLLAPVSVWCCDDTDVFDTAHAPQHTLDLCRMDLASGDVDSRRRAASQRHLSTTIDETKVSCEESAIHEPAFVVFFRIADRDRIAANKDPPASV